MSALLSIGWFIGMLISYALIGETGRMAAMIAMFPEGWRWWVFPARIAALALFAVLVLYHPF